MLTIISLNASDRLAGEGENYSGITDTQDSSDAKIHRRHCFAALDDDEYNVVAIFIP